MYKLAAKMVYDDGGVGGGESRVRESEGGDRIDRRMGSLFGLRRICPPEKFSGGGEWWPAVGGGGRINWGRKRESRAKLEKLSRNVIPTSNCFNPSREKRDLDDRVL
ncbi:hypothetical protein Tco_0520572 [Tanacetum coccineum]